MGLLLFLLKEESEGCCGVGVTRLVTSTLDQTLLCPKKSRLAGGGPWGTLTSYCCRAAAAPAPTANWPDDCISLGSCCASRNSKDESRLFG